MPNWVDNTLIVTGDEADVKAFVERAAQPTTQFGEERQSDLSFWNFIQPEDMTEYQLGWYEWNLKHWGCKWDAGSVDVPDRSDGFVQYTFDTPWGPPVEFYQTIVAQYPDLDFNLRYLEEQGWGGELAGSGGVFWIINEWDIPDTHEERMEHVGYCKCEEMRDDEMEWMYDDCPRKVEATAGQVQQTV